MYLLTFNHNLMVKILIAFQKFNFTLPLPQPNIGINGQYFPPNSLNNAMQAQLFKSPYIWIVFDDCDLKLVQNMTVEYINVRYKH